MLLQKANVSRETIIAERFQPTPGERGAGVSRETALLSGMRKTSVRGVRELARAAQVGGFSDG